MARPTKAEFQNFQTRQTLNYLFQSLCSQAYAVRDATSENNTILLDLARRNFNDSEHVLNEMLLKIVKDNKNPFKRELLAITACAILEVSGYNWFRSTDTNPNVKLNDDITLSKKKLFEIYPNVTLFSNFSKLIHFKYKPVQNSENWETIYKLPEILINMIAKEFSAKTPILD